TWVTAGRAPSAGSVGDVPASCPARRRRDLPVRLDGGVARQTVTVSDAQRSRVIGADGGADADHPKEACGVFAVHARGQSVAHVTYLGLFALQHRGQEAAGMAVSDGEHMTVVKDQGLVASVFNERTLAGLVGHLAIGHCRYSTTGSSTWRNAQPVYRSVGDHMLALGHNGNLVNTEELAREAGMLAGTVTSDSDLIAELIAAELTARGEGDAAVADVHAVDRGVGDGAGGPGHAGHGVVELEEAVAAVVTRLRGAFSLVLMDETRIIGVRDPHGFRPLCLGRLD